MGQPPQPRLLARPVNCSLSGCWNLSALWADSATMRRKRLPLEGKQSKIFDF